MKRVPLRVHDYLYRHRGWFAWQQCARCKTEFRREAGWRWLAGPWVNGIGRWRYLCFSCGGPTKVTATECIADVEEIPKSLRPPPPPGPPLPTRPVMPPGRWERERG